MGSFGKFTKGLWYGALIGAVGALLFAPKRGEELREDIRQQLTSFEEEAKTKAKSTLEQARDGLERTADKLEEGTATTL